MIDKYNDNWERLRYGVLLLHAGAHPRWAAEVIQAHRPDIDELSAVQTVAEAGRDQWVDLGLDLDAALQLCTDLWGAGAIAVVVVAARDSGAGRAGTADDDDTPAMTN
jgi:hypothetical protein